MIHSVFLIPLFLSLGPFAPNHKESQDDIEDPHQQEHESNDKEGQESSLEVKDAGDGLVNPNCKRESH